MYPGPPVASLLHTPHSSIAASISRLPRLSASSNLLSILRLRSLSFRLSSPPSLLHFLLDCPWLAPPSSYVLPFLDNLFIHPSHSNNIFDTFYHLQDIHHCSPLSCQAEYHKPQQLSNSNVSDILFSNRQIICTKKKKTYLNCRKLIAMEVFSSAQTRYESIFSHHNTNTYSFYLMHA